MPTPRPGSSREWLRPNIASGSPPQSGRTLGPVRSQSAAEFLTVPTAVTANSSDLLLCRTTVTARPCKRPGVFVGDEHAATVCELPDSKALREVADIDVLQRFTRALLLAKCRFWRGAQPVLPISSTPLPFHRNFTTLSRPSTPLEYFSVMVSPVVESAMPLNP
jgi:hypothetical protein